MLAQVENSCIISPEAQEVIASGAYHHEGLRRLAALLPVDDKELWGWLESTVEKADGAGFQMLISAAAMDERNLPAELLPAALMVQMGAYQVGWLAWRMQGNVTEALLRGLEQVVAVTKEVRALALFTATAWWQKYRPQEPVPMEIPRWLDSLAKDGRDDDLRANYMLSSTDLLLGRSSLARKPDFGKGTLTTVQARKQTARAMSLLNGPFHKLVYARETKIYISKQPRQRAAPDIERNDPCPCGSGKKYKKCCWLADQDRLSHSSSIAGVTREEIAGDLKAELTEAHFDAMTTSNILALDPARVPEDLQLRYILSLTVLQAYEKAIEAFERFGVRKDLESVWSHMFTYATGSWRPDIARKLMELLPDAEERFGEKMHAGTRLLLVGDDPAKVMQELEASAEALLKAKDIEDLERLSGTLLASPYRGLGILVARGVLPITEEEKVTGIFDDILDARAKLNLPSDDEFSDWMDEQTLRKARKNETAAAQEGQDKLEAKIEELRAAQEEVARLKRQEALHQRQAQRESEAAKAAPASEEDKAREREWKTKLKNANALVAQYGEEKLMLRRELEKSNREKEAKKASTGAPDLAADNDEDEDHKVEGNQPVRLIEFPEGFLETIAGYPRHVGRAAMNRLGRMASGEPDAFKAIKQLKAYKSVLRARVADKYRLLYCLLPDRIRVVDLVRRADLEQRIERLLAAGLPPVG